MPLAHLLIRYQPHYRRDAFAAGLQACGYTLAGEPRATPSREDVLVIWNRYGRNDATARRFESAGARVIVAENGPLGRDWQGETWYSLALDAPVQGGRTPAPDARRWESFGVPLCEWRKFGREVIVLAQRGIGPPGIAQPARWHLEAAERFRLHELGPVRIRDHPGESASTPLEEDLSDALCVVTWASGAALKAMLRGVPVLYGYEKWIGAPGGARLTPNSSPALARPNRLPVFHALASSMFRTHEIASGEPLRNVLALRSGR